MDANVQLAAANGQPSASSSASTAEADRAAADVTDQEREQRMQMFTQFRDHLWTLRQSNIEHADNLVLTLSAAILGLSVTFVKDVVPLQHAFKLWRLTLSWELLAASIVGTLASYWAARNEIERQTAYAEEYYLNRKDEYLSRRNWWKSLTDACNFLASACFIAAVVLQVWFVSTNLYRERSYLAKRPPAAAQQSASASH